MILGVLQLILSSQISRACGLSQSHINWQALRDTAGVMSLLHLAQQQKLPLTDCLLGTHINPDDIEKPFATVRCWQEMTLIRNLQHLLGDEISVGLSVIPYFSLDVLGLLGIGMRACENVEQAFIFSGQYQNFGLAFSQVRATKQNGVMTITVNEQAVPDDCKTFCVDRGLAVCTHWMRQLAGQQFTPSSVELRMPRPKYAPQQEAFFNTAINYNCTHNLVIFNNDVATSPIASANLKNLQICQHFCSQMRQQQTKESKLDEKIRQLLLTHEFNLNGEQIAEFLQMSGRSLRRHLSDMNTSLRQCIFETRMAHAQLLLNQGQSIEQVANQVGYAEKASFARAFKTFTAQSPGQYARRRNFK